MEARTSAGRFGSRRTPRPSAGPAWNGSENSPGRQPPRRRAADPCRSQRAPHRYRCMASRVVPSRVRFAQNALLTTRPISDRFSGSHTGAGGERGRARGHEPPPPARRCQPRQAALERDWACSPTARAQSNAPRLDPTAPASSTACTPTAQPREQQQPGQTRCTMCECHTLSHLRSAADVRWIRTASPTRQTRSARRWRKHRVDDEPFVPRLARLRCPRSRRYTAGCEPPRLGPPLPIPVDQALASDAQIAAWRSARAGVRAGRRRSAPRLVLTR